MRQFSKPKTTKRPLLLACMAFIAGCAGQAEQSKPSALPETKTASLPETKKASLPEAKKESRPKGYLPTDALPNSLALLPKPPEAGSAAFTLDEEYSKKSLALINTAAWELAKLDADINFPDAAGAFSCALNAPITQEDTPHLYTLLQRTLVDAAASTLAAKDHYNRKRPFMTNDKPTCSPDWEERLKKSGSYPSGHTSVGMAWALILAEVSPKQADAILARGQAFGRSRIVCNVHWHSDTIQGHYIGAYTVARLHTDATFRADLEAAKGEVDEAQTKGLKPTRDCKAEAAGIALQQQLEP